MDIISVSSRSIKWPAVFFSIEGAGSLKGVESG